MANVTLMLKPMTMNSKGEWQVTNIEIVDSWGKFLAEEYNCHPDQNGNYPCDNGGLCDRCCTNEAAEKFRKKIKIGA